MNMESRAAEAIHLVIKAISEARKNVEQYQVAVQRAVAALQAQFGVDEDDGYVAVVAMSANRSTFLGTHVHIKRDVWEKVFNIPAPKVLAHCSMDVIEMLKAQHESQTPV